MTEQYAADTVVQRLIGSERRRMLILLGITCLIFFYNMGGWELWNPDEPRYALVAREMRDTGEWIVPHLNGDEYPDKPPLFFWLIALGSLLTGGVNEVSARFPSAAAALGVILLTAFLGRRIFGERAGFFASLVLLTSSEFFWLGRRANIDMTLTLCTTLAFTFFYLGVEEPRKPRPFYLLPFLFMGLGVLTKGPVGFLLPLLSILSYLAVTKRLGHLKKMEFLWGMLLFALIVAAWLVPACIRGGEAYTSEILFTQNIDRYANAWNHQQPFYYYLYVFPAGFAPWVLLLPAALVWGFSKTEQANRTRLLFPLAWFLTIFVFFSISGSKRELYLLPLYPAAALLLGGFIRYATSPAFRAALPWKSLTIPLYALGGLLAVAGIGLCVFPFVPSPASGIFSFFPYLALLSMVFLVGGIVTLAAVRRRQFLACLGTIILALVLSFLLAVSHVLPKINVFKSAKPLSALIVNHLPPGEEVVALGVKTAPFIYYSGLPRIRELLKVEEFLPYLESGWHGLMLMQEKKFRQLQESHRVPPGVTVLERTAIGHRTFVLLRKGA